MIEKPYDVVSINNQKTLYLQSDKLEDCLSYYRANNVDKLSIIPTRGYKLNDLEFVRDHPYITNLAIVFSPTNPFDITPIYTLKHLRSLTLSENVGLSLDEFPVLEEFHGIWDPGLNLANCKTLKILDLSKYQSRAKDLTGFPFLPSLCDLGLVQSPITTLHGIAQFCGIKRIELAYLTKLESLHDVEALQNLETLNCQVCRKLRDHDIVRSLKSLHVLRFNQCGGIPSIQFLNEMTCLEEFRFVDTNIADGDLTPLFRLKRVGFIAKKHYSHKPDEIDKIIAKNLA